MWQKDTVTRELLHLSAWDSVSDVNKNGVVLTGYSSQGSRRVLLPLGLSRLLRLSRTTAAPVHCRVHSVEGGRVLQAAARHQDIATCVAASPCGRFLASGAPAVETPT
jgi:hypothetical protein